jgi:hypothetical protein
VMTDELSLRHFVGSARLAPQIAPSRRGVPAI